MQGKGIMRLLGWSTSCAVRGIITIEGTYGITNVFWVGKERQEYFLHANG